MPFNGSGTFEPLTAPTFPAVAGTTITASYFNAVINDLINNGFNNCLTRDNQGKPSAGMNWNGSTLSNVSIFSATSTVTAGGQFLAANGSLSAPSYSFTNESNSGFYTNAVDGFAAVCGGGKIIDFTTAGMAITGTLSCTGNATLGDASGDSVTINASTVTLTNGVNFATGNVGIGATPNRKLDVRGILRSTDTANTVHCEISCNTTEAYIGTNNNFPLIFQTNGTDRGRFDTSGNLLVGTSAASTYRLVIQGGASGSLLVNTAGGNPGFVVSMGTILTNYSSSNAVAYVSRDSTSSRSINAAGTVNTSGADYAEYMSKSPTCGTIAKGQIVGVDANGELTDDVTKAHSFVIKSTDPAYVGGDIWGNEDAVGRKPAAPDEDADDEAKAAYAEALGAWEARLEAARQRVDRIAFSGQVPVNVLGAVPGQYIVATHDGSDNIIGIAMWKADIDDEDRERVVGKVWKILPDGRAWVKVL